MRHRIDCLLQRWPLSIASAGADSSQSDKQPLGALPTICCCPGDAAAGT